MSSCIDTFIVAVKTAVIVLHGLYVCQAFIRLGPQANYANL